MNAVELTKALRGKWHGSYGTARCPAHPDKTPSLSISIGRDGRTLVRCHAGCDQEQVIAELRRLRLWGGDVETNLRSFTPAPNRNSAYALDLWAECIAAQGTSVETYLAARGITVSIPACASLPSRAEAPGRWHLARYGRACDPWRDRNAYRDP